MTEQEMEAEVETLLLEQRRLARFRLQLPPQKLLLLKRLLYRLGYTKMPITFSRKGELKRYSEQPALSNHDAMIRHLVENPDDYQTLHVLADAMDDAGLPGQHLARAATRRVENLSNSGVPLLIPGYFDSANLTGDFRRLSPNYEVLHPTERGRFTHSIRPFVKASGMAWDDKPGPKVLLHVSHLGDRDPQKTHNLRDMINYLVPVHSKQHLEHLMSDWPMEMGWTRKEAADLRNGLSRFLPDTHAQQMSRKETPRRFAAPGEGQITVQPARQVGHQQFVHDVHDETGKRIGGISLQHDGGDTLHVTFAGMRGMGDNRFNALGPAHMRSGLNQLKALYPMVKKINRVRIGGAVEKNTGEMRQSTLNLQRKVVRFARPHVPFSEVKPSMWHNPRHRSGLSVTARILQRMVSVHNNQDVRALANSALRGNTTALYALQDKLEEINDPHAGMNWGDGADYINNSTGGYSFGSPGFLDTVIRGVPGRNVDQDAKINAMVEGARRAVRRQGFRSHAAPYLSRIASVFKNHPTYGGLAEVINHHIGRKFSSDPFLSLSGEVSGGYQTEDRRSRILMRDGKDRDGKPIKWLSVSQWEPHENGQHMKKKWGMEMTVPADPQPEVKDLSEISHYRESRRLPVKKYAKVDGHEKAHPLVAGFPIEHALRHLANDPKNADSIRNLAAIALTGKNKLTGEVKPEGMPEALWALHDALQEHMNEDGSLGHKMAKTYNWMSAADKVLIDKHTATALREASEDTRRRHPHEAAISTFWSMTPEGHATRAAHALRKTGRNPSGDPFGVHDKEMLGRIRARVGQLIPGIDQKHVDESIRRHAHRSDMVWRERQGFGPSNDYTHDQNAALQPIPKAGALAPGGTHVQTENEKATRYRRLPPKRYSMAVRGDFLDSLRRIKSSNQAALHQTANEVAKKLGLHPIKVFNALHDTPTGSVPGIAQAVYGGASPEQIHAAASWLGLTANIPGVAVFHPRPSGPDVLHRMRQDGAGMDIRTKLDRVGLTNRVLIPHKTGFDILIPDHGGSLANAVQQYAQTHKLAAPQASPGFFHEIGSNDQAQARASFRNKVVQSEKMQRRGSRVTMSRHEAFLGAIKQNPDDLTTRKVFADYLEEEAPETTTQTVIDRLRNHDGPMWIGMSPGGKVNAIPRLTREHLEKGIGQVFGDLGTVDLRGTKKADTRRSNAVRVNGRMRTWARDPNRFQVPWKFGMYGPSGHFNENNVHEWLTENPLWEPD